MGTDIHLVVETTASGQSRRHCQVLTELSARRVIRTGGSGRSLGHGAPEVVARLFSG